MRALSRLLALLFLVCTAALARASYDPPTLADLIMASETVVQGRIESLTDTHYTLRVEHWLRRDPASADEDGPLTVRRFEDWECAQRGRPYAVGQRLLVFLKRREGELLLRGGGCEGEWYFDDDDDAAAMCEAVTAFADRFVPVGGDQWVPTWRRMLRDGNPQLRRLAVESLCDTSAFNRGCGDFLLEGLLDLLADDDLRTRREITLWLPWLLTRDGRLHALGRLCHEDELAENPTLAAAAIALAPYEVAHHRAMLRALADDTLPLPLRRDTAEGLGWALVQGGDLAVVADLRTELTAWFTAAQDPELLTRVALYLDEMLGSRNTKKPESVEAERKRVLALLAEPFPPEKVRAVRAKRLYLKLLELDDSAEIAAHLSPTDRMVAWDPRLVPGKPLFETLGTCDAVRWARAGLAAERAGDVETALAALRYAAEYVETDPFPVHLAPLTPEELTQRIEDLRRKFVQGDDRDE